MKWKFLLKKCLWENTIIIPLSCCTYHPHFVMFRLNTYLNWKLNLMSINGLLFWSHIKIRLLYWSITSDIMNRRKSNNNMNMKYNYLSRDIQLIQDSFSYSSFRWGLSMTVALREIYKLEYYFGCHNFC